MHVADNLNRRLELEERLRSHATSLVGCPRRREGRGGTGGQCGRGDAPAG